MHGTMQAIETTNEMVTKLYSTMESKLKQMSSRLQRPFTLAEKILFGHLEDPLGQELKPGESILALRPDRVAMQDATAQMALLQYLSSGRRQTAVPTTVHCDHLIRAESGADKDMHTALDENREVYDFLATASARAGIGFWKPGAGNHPSGGSGELRFSGRAHDWNRFAHAECRRPWNGRIGVGGADAVDVMAGLPWEVKYPKLVGVHLTGEMKGWTAPKDIICYLCEVLTVKGGTNRIIEYFGPGVARSAVREKPR